MDGREVVVELQVVRAEVPRAVCGQEGDGALVREGVRRAVVIVLLVVIELVGDEHLLGVVVAHLLRDVINHN